MKQIARGIVLKRKPYSESSIILSVITENNGLETFLFQGAKKKKGISLFPLAPIHFSYFKRIDSTLGKITETDLAFSVYDLCTHPVKTSIGFFIADLLLATNKEEKIDQELFRFLWKEIEWINESNELTNYPLWFLATYSRFCGVIPSIENTSPTVFDIPNGSIQKNIPNHPAYYTNEKMHWLENAFLDEKESFLALSIPKADRIYCLDILIKYYEFHIHGMHNLKSLEVLRLL